MTDVIHIPIKDLKLLENNPRTIDKAQFEKLCQSLREDETFFCRRPCLVNLQTDGTKRVYAGNQRVQAAKKLGWKKVPCIVDSDLDEKTLQSRIIKDNMHYGAFDYDLTFSLFDVDTLLGAGFTPEQLTGDYGDIQPVDDEPKKGKANKLKMCPQCGHEF